MVPLDSREMQREGLLTASNSLTEDRGGAQPEMHRQLVSAAKHLGEALRRPA